MCQSFVRFCYLLVDLLKKENGVAEGLDERELFVTSYKWSFRSKVMRVLLKISIQ